MRTNSVVTAFATGAQSNQTEPSQYITSPLFSKEGYLCKEYKSAIVLSQVINNNNNNKIMPLSNSNLNNKSNSPVNVLVFNNITKPCLRIQLHTEVTILTWKERLLARSLPPGVFTTPDPD